MKNCSEWCNEVLAEVFRGKGRSFDMTSSLWALKVYPIHTFCFSVNEIYDIIDFSLFIFVLKSPI